MYYFSSDTHFGDKGTLVMDMRPFKNAKQFDRYVIKTWNKQTTKDDTIFIVGDFIDCDGPGCDSWKKTLKYVKKLKAKVVLIIGNNEQRVIKYYFNNSFEDFKTHCLNLGFKDVCQNLQIHMFKQNFYLTHKPKNHNPNMLNLYGHIHRSGGIYKPFGFNVGCDLNHFRLYSEKDIQQLIDMKNDYWDTDQNIRF